MRGQGSPWTEDRVAQLRQLWAAGKSCQQIADEIGSGLTRNSVIGKVHRIGLSARQGREVLEVQRERAVKARARRAKWRAKVCAAKRLAPPIVTLPLVPVVDHEIPVEQRRTILTVREGQCKFPFGDPRDSDFSLCGGQALLGLSWCGYHARVVYQPRSS